MAKSSKSSVRHLMLANTSFSVEQVTDAFRNSERKLLAKGKLKSGAELLRVDLDKDGFVTDCYVDDRDGVAKLVGRSLAKKTRKARIAVKSSKMRELLKN